MTTLDLLNEYLTDYFIEHDYEKIYAFLTDDVHCYGFAENIEIESLEDGRKMVESGVYQQYMSYSLDIHNGKNISDDSAIIYYSLTHTGVTVEYRLIGNSRITDTGRKLCLLSFSMINPNQNLTMYNDMAQNLNRISSALFSIVPMVISANLTKGRYEMLNYEHYDTKLAAWSGTYDELISVGVQSVPQEFKKIFEDTFKRESVLKAYENGESVISLIHQQIGDDGVVRWIKTRCIFVRDKTNDDLYTITMATDVSPIKQQQLDLQLALETAEAATQAKSEFLSRMSHEIRTPMNAIMGMTAIAKSNRGDYAQVSECLNKIDMSSHFLLTLINDILEMSRIESGRTEIKHTEFNFDLLAEGIKTVVEPLALKRNIRYEYINNAECDGYYVGDVVRVQQILVNLITNAIKFTRSEGRVRFSVNIDSQTENQTLFIFTIADTGIGMSEQFMEKMFEPFTQEDGSNTSEYGGSGLGLAISKNLVAAMNGTISVESLVGIGTTFTVKLPLDRLSYSEHEKQIPKPLDKKIDLTVLKGSHIIMAEDHPLNVMVGRKLLEQKGINVTIAENGQIAVNIFENSQPFKYDAILMDIRMPVMDGLDAAKKIRSLKRDDAAKVPIIAMTANALDEDRQNSRAAGMNEHLAKPFDPTQLYNVLAQEIQLAKLNREKTFSDRGENAE